MSYYLFRPKQPYRVFNAWMGDPIQILLLEAVLQTIEAEDLLTHVCYVGNYLLCQLNTLQHEFSDIISSVRGRGFIIAFDTRCRDMKKKLMHLLRNKGNIKNLIYSFDNFYILLLYSKFANVRYTSGRLWNKINSIKTMPNIRRISCRYLFKNSSRLLARTCRVLMYL